MAPRNNRRLLVVLALMAAAVAALLLYFGRGPGSETAEVATVTPLVVDPPAVVPSPAPSPVPVASPAPAPAAVAPASDTKTPAAAAATPAADAAKSNDVAKDPITTGPGHQIDTSGAVRVTPSMDVKLSRKNMQLLRHYELGTTSMKVKLCITEFGVVHSLDVLRSSGVKEVDTDMTTQLRSWKYLPAVSNGAPTASCQDVTLNYQLDE